jgi:hypothetical protein
LEVSITVEEGRQYVKRKKTRRRVWEDSGFAFAARELAL